MMLSIYYDMTLYVCQIGTIIGKINEKLNE